MKNFKFKFLIILNTILHSCSVFCEKQYDWMTYKNTFLMPVIELHKDALKQSLNKKKFKSKQNQNKLTCFVEKMKFNENDIIFAHGDFHAGQPFYRFINKLIAEKLIDPVTYKLQTTKNGGEVNIVFYGDYADRGDNGVEIYQLISQLKCANPERVYLVKGNHEDIALMQAYGFYDELIQKFGIENSGDIIMTFDKLFNLLPSVLYCQKQVQNDCNDVLMFNHGGIEFFDPKAFLESDKKILHIDIKKERNNFFEQHKELKAIFEQCNLLNKCLYFDVNGFEWNDFDLKNKERIHLNPYRAFEFGKSLVKKYFEACSDSSNKIKAQVSGHQHSGFENDALMNKLIEHYGIYNCYQNQSVTPLPQMLFEIKSENPAVLKTNVTCIGNIYATINYDFINIAKEKKIPGIFDADGKIVDYFLKIFFENGNWKRESY